ncbi:hypothetical protein MA16_Dca026894 [Dendrobium catenatum]|uniref:Uncharacterized protein n=1 Tax=Dendrobium catenatum TaxID=906689 RepID=A0A2I0VHB6_9ASPA|nr:hypothetical protein MA16_Dca026894 [Dendrobium catenatum]
MEIFPSYCTYYKSLEHSKLNCSVLHPKVVDANTTNSPYESDKLSNVVHENVQGNVCVDLSLHENVVVANASHLKNGILITGDVGHSIELVSDVPILAIVHASENAMDLGCFV